MSTKNTGRLMILWLLFLTIGATTSNKNPVILVPGMRGSRIDAKFNEPEKVQPKCGIQPNVYTNIWLNTLWMRPLTIDCLINIMKMEYNKDSRTMQNLPGVDIRVPGWGQSYPVENIDPKLSPFGMYFGNLSDMLVVHGLVRDVSLRGAPYDFRKTPNDNMEFFLNLKMLTEETYTRNNNKPVVLIAHSMGGNMVLVFLQRQTQEWKKKYVRSFVSLAGAWGGSVCALKTFVDGDDLGFNGLDARAIRAMIITFPSMLWFLPSPKIWDKNEVLVEIDKISITVEDDYKSFYEKIGYTTGYEMYQDIKRFLNLDPPGVEVHCLHGIGVPTLDKITYGPDEFLKVNGNYTFGDGDKTVNIRSLRVCTDWSGKQTEPVIHREFPGIDHTMILSNPAVMDYIKQLMDTY